MVTVSLPAQPANGVTKARILTVWHILSAVGMLIIALLAYRTYAAKPANFLPLVAALLLVALAVASGLSAIWIIQRKANARILSLLVNYLGFIISVIGLLQVLGVFVGIDALAKTFARGLPFLLGVFGGYLVVTLGDRFEHNYEREQLFRAIGKWMAIAFGVAFLVAVGILQGLWALILRFNRPEPFIFTGAVVLFGVMTVLMWREPMITYLRNNNSHEITLSGLLFLSPNLLGFLFFFAGPLLFSLFISFTNSDGFGTRDWVGLKNYAELLNLDIKPLASPNQVATEALDTKIFDELTRVKLFGQNFIIGAQDKLFWLAMKNTLLFCLLAVPLSVIPALFLANVLNSKIPGMKFFRALYFLPSIAAVVGVALIWQWLYNASVGFINYGITTFVTWVDTAFKAGWVDPKVRWLSESSTALLAVVIMSAWQTMGFNTVLLLAGLQNVPRELYEAASVDGAGSWRKFWSITLPMLAPTTFFVITTTTIQALQVFEQVYIATNPPGGPNNATLVLVLYLYQNGFQRFRQGYASATAWVLFLVIFLVTMIQFRGQRSRGAVAD